MGDGDGGVRVFKQSSHTSTPPFTFKAFRDNFTLYTIEQFNCTISCRAVCHDLCYSYSQSVAPFSSLIASSIQTKISNLYSTAIIQCVCSFIFTYC